MKIDFNPLHVEEPVEINMVEIIEDFDMEVEEEFVESS